MMRWRNECNDVTVEAFFFKKKRGLCWDCWRSIELKKKVHICVWLSKGFFKCLKFFFFFAKPALVSTLEGESTKRRFLSPWLALISASVCADYSPARKGVRESRLGKVGLRRGEVTPCCLTHLLSPAAMGTAVAGAVWDWRGRLVRSACPSLPLTGWSAAVVVERFGHTPPPP